MCSFFLTNVSGFDLSYVNYYLKFRGPDATSTLTEEGYTYVHNLLSITGEFTTQPLVQDGIILVYNGEIYNYNEYHNYASDGHFILDHYHKGGVDSLKDLDGEFAIAIHDRPRGIFILASDPFGTKPLYWAHDKNIGISSYESTLQRLGFTEIKRLEPNTILVLDEKDYSIKHSSLLYEFNLDQYVDSYDDWANAFTNSILKRTRNLKHKIVLPLSSGYDSGAIHCLLNELGIGHNIISVSGIERADILASRHLLANGSGDLIPSINSDEQSNVSAELRQNSEPFYYGPDPYTRTHDGFNDPGSIGLYYILKRSKEKFGSKVVMSGHGSDEMMTNIKAYGFRTSNPLPFPADLRSVFPWGNFYHGSNSSYLRKEESIAGSLGLETRYPFLDKYVIQSFLNLTPEAKNAEYKGPICHIFRQHNYPFWCGKVGFNIT